VRSYWDRDACEEKGKNETDEQAFTWHAIYKCCSFLGVWLCTLTIEFLKIFVVNYKIIVEAELFWSKYSCFNDDYGMCESITHHSRFSQKKQRF
jgi:hypothetical protein